MIGKIKNFIAEVVLDLQNLSKDDVNVEVIFTKSLPEEDVESEKIILKEQLSIDKIDDSVVTYSCKINTTIAGVYNYAGENILYSISPLGESEYNDIGGVDLNGIKVNLVTCRTKILFFEDTERIYSDPDTLLPIKVERNISKLWIKEYITEEPG